MDFLPASIADYGRAHSQHPEPAALLREVADYTHTHLAMPQMLTGPWAGAFLQAITRTLNARRVIEIGTFSGYSALCMAGGMSDEGHLTTIEYDPHHAAVARRFFQQSPFSNRITLMEGDATALLPGLSGPFDLAFIDADKKNYLQYYAMLKPMMRRGGVMLFDNALWSGAVLAPSDAAAQGIHTLNETVTRDPEVMNILIPLRDGIQMVIKQ